MAKVLACRDAGIDCDYVACADTDDGVMKLVSEHVRKDHGIEKFTPEQEQQTRSLIHEEAVQCR